MRFPHGRINKTGNNTLFSPILYDFNLRITNLLLSLLKLKLSPVLCNVFVATKGITYLGPTEAV